MKLHVHTGGLGPIDRHLAVEDLLLSEPAADRVDLFFYRCEPCVVLGKNQIPWRECQPGRLAARRIAIARRMSGGGAVYHDPGNLNVSFVLPRSAYDTGTVMRIFLEALGALGIWAACPERSRLVWNDAKISGQAFAYRRDRVLHHGTLLLASDLQALQDALLPCAGVFDSSAVASTPARVANLGLPEERVTTALVDATVKILGTAKPVPGAPALLLPLGQDWAWIYGRTPAFTWRKTPRAGQASVVFRVEHGRVMEWQSGDTGDAPLPDAGVPLSAPGWQAYLDTLPPVPRARLADLLPVTELPP